MTDCNRVCIPSLKLPALALCDNARYGCPVFPGGGLQLHWGQEDPAAAQGWDEQRLAEFRRIRDQIRERIRTL